MYHFKNICTEDPSIELKDESEKIFISTHGIYQDTSPELKEYLEFVQAENTDQFKAETEYVKKLQKRVARIKNNKLLEKGRKDIFAQQVCDDAFACTNFSICA